MEGKIEENIDADREQNITNGISLGGVDGLRKIESLTCDEKSDKYGHEYKKRPVRSEKKRKGNGHQAGEGVNNLAHCLRANVGRTPGTLETIKRFAAPQKGDIHRSDENGMGKFRIHSPSFLLLIRSSTWKSL